MPGVTCEEPLPVREARAGDPEAWDALVKRYQLPLYAYVFQLVRDEQTSLDIVQETFVNAARHIERLRVEQKFGSWLFSIAHQKCIQRWRRPTPEEPLPETSAEDVAGDNFSPLEWLLHKEEEEQFMAALNQLPWPQRSVLVLHFLEEFSLEEIANISGLAIGTVKSRLHYAKKALRKFMLEQL